jgi:hypothetical protein
MPSLSGLRTQHHAQIRIQTHLTSRGRNEHASALQPISFYGLTHPQPATLIQSSSKGAGKSWWHVLDDGHRKWKVGRQRLQ